MSILNVNQIQPVGGGNTITVSASDVSASGATITASSFVGNVTGNVTSSSTSEFSSGLNVTGGSVGIGTNNPQEDLHIGSNSPYILLDDYDNARKWRLKGTAWFAIEDTTAGVDRIRILSNGNIGIGTDNPTRKLDVEIQTASGAVGSVLSSHPIAEFINISAGAPRGLEIGAPPDGFLSPVYLKVSGTGSRFAILDQSNHENFTILDSGNIGIGTDTPSHKLDVVGNTQLYGTLVIGDNTDISPTANGAGQLHIDGNGYTPYIAADGTAMYVGHNSNIRDLRLQTNETDRLTIDGSTGNIGIGTDNPSRQLEIFHTTQAALALKTSDTGQSSVWFSDESDSNVAGLYFEHDNEAMVARTGDQPRLLINQNGSLFNVKGTNTNGTGGTILGRYKYTQLNQGNGYAHLILAPDGRKLQDYINDNNFCYITVVVTGTGTDNMYCQYFYSTNTSPSWVTFQHIRGNSAASSNRPYMNLQNTYDPAWLMSHAGGYTVDIEVAIYGGRSVYTYNPLGGITSFGANP